MAVGRGAARKAARGEAKSEVLFDEAFMAKLEYLDIVAKKRFVSQQRGERRSKRIGAGLEFADHRRYSPGDDFKNIDWNVYARMGRLLVRLYEEEEDLYVYLLVDSSASMAVGDQTKFDYARKLAAALAYITLSSLDRVSVLPFSAELGQQLVPARGKAQIFRVFDFLGGVRPGGRTSMTDAFKAFVHQTRRRGLAVVISDFYAQDGYEDGLNYLRYNKFEPFVIQLTDDRELEPSLRGDVLLVDCETGLQKEMTVTPRLLSKYRAAHAAWCDELEAFCKKRQVSYFRTPVQVPFDDLMLRIFRAGGFLT
ncbi:MAG: DUF58 domain-containing protein [Deltaproteobacteria bacterium]|nr:MAG: DUF58 domain-containing protein [Deltaproteobacteria bacterium]